MRHSLFHFRGPWPPATCVLCSAVVSLLAAADVSAMTMQSCGSFNVTFYDSGETDGGSVVSKGNWDAQQIGDVLAGISAWTHHIHDTPGRQVELHVGWKGLAGEQLVDAKDYLYGDGTTAWTYTELVYRQQVKFDRSTKIGCDASLIFDADAAGHGWNFGPEAPAPNEMDFRSIVTHELGHFLGFKSSYSSSTNCWSADGLTEWSKRLADEDGNHPFLGEAGQNGGFDVLDNPVYFVGAKAMEANGGSKVAVFAPSVWSETGSLCDLDTSTSSANVMRSSIAPGVACREPSALDCAVLKDLGWNVAPEPGTPVMLIVAGLASLAWRWRRRFSTAS